MSTPEIEWAREAAQEIRQYLESAETQSAEQYVYRRLLEARALEADLATEIDMADSTYWKKRAAELRRMAQKVRDGL